MKLVIAQMKHETNTFSPVPTPLARFAQGRETPLTGNEIREAFRDTGSAIGAFIDLADRAGAEVERIRLAAAKESAATTPDPARRTR